MHGNSDNSSVKFSEKHINLIKAYGFMLHCLRREFENQGYIELRLPSIHMGSKDGQFNFGFFGKEARLAASNALYINIYSQQIGRVYSIQKFFRKETSITNKHLAEFDMLGVGLPDMDLSQGMLILQSLIQRIIKEMRISPYSNLLKVNRECDQESFAHEDYQKVLKNI